MEATALNPTQKHLLMLFSHNNTEAYAKEVRDALKNYFQEKLDKEDDRLWDEGILSQEKLSELRYKDFHKKEQ